MQKLVILFFSLIFVSCDPADIQRAIDTLSDTPLTEAETASGLKEALNFGVDSAVKYLSVEDGFYKTSYKILLPEEARKVTDKLQSIPGFSTVEEEILKRINRAAEDAASKAGPIFLTAIKEITFQDAMGILLGEKNAATTYLNNKTYNPLYGEFQPVILESLNKFNAVDYWEDVVNTYNSLPLVDDVNPRLDDYVAQKALLALFDLIEKKELGIRQNISERVTPLLKKVFSKQDG